MKTSRHKAVAAALFAVFTVQSAAPVFAHNERIHQGMTDYAYHLTLAMAAVSAGDTTSNPLVAELAAMLTDHPDLPSFFSAAGHARPKLRALRSGLLDDPMLCFDPDLLALVDDDNDLLPDWQLVAATLAEEKMGRLNYPITTRYAHKNATCEIDKTYTPIGSTVFVNPESGSTPKEKFRSRDYTGVTLGYWAGGPDRALTDWIFRSTTLETLQTPAVQIGTGIGVSALAMAACAIACGLMPVLCAVCPAIAIGAGIYVIDAINDIDASSMEHDDFTGLGHHIDMKPLQPGDSTFDDKRGKFMEKAGPGGNPDLLEEMVIALYDLLGWHVRHDLSNGPAAYQITAPAPRRRSSRFRAALCVTVGDGHRRAHRLHTRGQPRHVGMDGIQGGGEAGRRDAGRRAGGAGPRLVAPRARRRHGPDARRRRHRFRPSAVRRGVRQPMGTARHRRPGQARRDGDVRAAGARDRQSRARVARVHPAVARRQRRHDRCAGPRSGDAAGLADAR